VDISGLIQGWRWCLAAAALALALLANGNASAHETDNFFLPLDSDLADIGPFLEMLHTVALEHAVSEANARIDKALRIKDAQERTVTLKRLHNPMTLLEAFIGQFGHPMFEDTHLERSLRGDWARRAYPGRVTSHQDLWMNFSAHLPLDLRRWMMLTQSRTVKACGVYFGGDKLVHFHHIGADYYRMFDSLVKSGMDRDDAYRKVVAYFVGGAFFSEKRFFGTMVTGVYSNADLAANHVGFKFFVNLTEPVLLKGAERKPLALRAGAFWRLNEHVRPGSGWFGAFVSDHWNEALNPNLYGPSLRAGIRRTLERRAGDIVRFYTRKDGRPDDPAYFGNLARELSTYHGESYGHCGEVEKLMNIGNTCMPALAAKPDVSAAN
jgi:hypothetical protein